MNGLQVFEADLHEGGGRIGCHKGGGEFGKRGLVRLYEGDIHILIGDGGLDKAITKCSMSAPECLQVL